MAFESGESFRSDATVIPVNFAAMFVTFGFMIFVASEYLLEAGHLALLVVAIAAALAASVFYPVRWWKLTTYRVGETGVEVKRETWFRLDKIIPYGKIASVNLTRGLPNRILGTSNVVINANAGPSAVVPEATIWLKAADAERLKEIINARMTGPGKEPVFEEAEFVSLVNFTAKDSVIQGVFGQPSAAMFGTLLSIALALFFAFFDREGLTITFVILAVSFAIPAVVNIVKYYDFRVRRVGDTIHIRHGAIWNYSSSFETVKVNAIRVKKPLLARLIGKSSIEAEVIGVTQEKGERPLLCLMVKDEVLPHVISELIPEFSENVDLKKQPKEARYPLLAGAAIRSIVTAAILYPLLFFAIDAASGEFEIPWLISDFGALGAVALTTLLHFFWMDRRMRIEALALGDETMTVVRGVVDRERVTMMYDRVQIVEAVSDPFSRPFGLSRCSFSLLSSVGATNERTGYFETDVLEGIGDTLVERIRSGKRSYSYKSF
ncbi:MAG: PH domain-containing protein [Thermoplasmatales archaeon]|nr:PH domain-containing protein [Thermoplasmatales archaeon]